MSAGKGDSPRNCFSREFRENFDAIFRNHEPIEIWDRYGRRVICRLCGADLRTESIICDPKRADKARPEDKPYLKVKTK